LKAFPGIAHDRSASIPLHSERFALPAEALRPKLYQAADGLGAVDISRLRPGVDVLKHIFVKPSRNDGFGGACDRTGARHLVGMDAAKPPSDVDSIAMTRGCSDVKDRRRKQMTLSRATCSNRALGRYAVAATS